MKCRLETMETMESIFNFIREGLCPSLPSLLSFYL
jgi:hypothetical protein